MRSLQYQKLKRWFIENYGHLGYDLSAFYTIDNEIVSRFDILRFGRETEIKQLNLEIIIDVTESDSDLRKLLFDALFRQHGYNVDNNFLPLKKNKEFNL